MVEPDGDAAQIERVAALRDPTRRALYRHVARADEPVGREEAASAVGVSASLAAFHLDKLVGAGLLRASYRRLSGRSGPGAGRPAKLYERSSQEVSVALPARRYELAARLLLDAVEAGGGADAAERLRAAARQLGESTGSADAAAHGSPRSRAASLARVEPLLSDLGYEPDGEDGSLVLRNCPFHALAQQSTTLICGMNLDLVGGMLDGLGARGVAAELAPQPGRCCVVIRPARSA